MYNKSMNGFMALLAFVVAWFVAQVTKLIAFVVKNKKANKEQILNCIIKSGGMPSGHAASTIGMTTYFGLSLGADSPIFALALCFALIVIYDAINVRYAVGEHGKILKKMTNDKEMKIVEGHTFGQVCVGIMLGVIVGVVVFAFFG